MIDREAQSIRYLIAHNKKGYAAGTVVCAAALAAAVYFGKYYTGWIGIPKTEDLFFIDRGDFLENTWVRQEDGYLYADGNAQMARGQMIIDGNIYVFGRDGKMLTGWLDTEAGLMHLRGSGKASRGWEMVDGTVYYFDSDGIRQSGWLQLEDGKYYLEEDGSRVTGWKEVDGSRYYFDADGAMQTGWVNIDGAWYMLADSGEMLTGDQMEGDKSYHLNEDGTRYYGWLETEEGKRYYLKTGEAAEGWTEIDGEKYYFGDDFLLKTGFVLIGDEVYYLEEDGTVREGWHEAVRDAEDEDEDSESDDAEAGDSESGDGGSEDSESGDSENGDPEEEDGGSDDSESEDGGSDDSILDDYGYEDFYVMEDGCVLDFDGEAGDFGRLLIRRAGIDVAVYTAREREDYQKIVDKENSAVAVKERRDVEYVIADRRSQGFDLSDIKEGDRAYLIRGRAEIVKYTCSRVCIGTNTGKDVVDDEENSLFRQNEGGLCAYSSAGQEDPAKVMVTFWDVDDSSEEESE